MNTTKIEWADITINPVVGCSKCSPGCDNCYAEQFAARLAKHPNEKIRAKYAGVVDERGKWTGVIDFDVSCLTNLPKKPKRIFVGSMCDLFHDSVMDSHLEHIFGHIGLTRANQHHTFMILTKRPQRMLEFFTNWKPYREIPNLWLGVTVCNQEEAEAKIPMLLATPAAKRFVSVEPMLGPMDLDKDEFLSAWRCQIDIPTLDWVICGGETGPNARPMHFDWVRSLRNQCEAADVPFFFKSWGAWLPTDQWLSEPGGKSVCVYEDGSTSAAPEQRGLHYIRTFFVKRPESGLFYGEEVREVPA